MGVLQGPQEVAFLPKGHDNTNKETKMTATLRSRVAATEIISEDAPEHLYEAQCSPGPHFPEKAAEAQSGSVNCPLCS